MNHKPQPRPKQGLGAWEIAGMIAVVLGGAAFLAMVVWFIVNVGRLAK